MAKSMLDASWNRFRTYVMYKAANAGRKVVLVNPAYISQVCSELWCNCKEGSLGTSPQLFYMWIGHG
jgi:putative transposase